MKLQRNSAQQIVNEIGKLVKQNINMMDETGTIIASTDSNRIGQEHEGAQRVISEHLPELYINLEEETSTVKRGLNLPITFGTEVVGVIGITGTYENVVGYGQVVKKMTEILIRERYNLKQERLDTRVKNRFLEDWILAEGTTNPIAIADRGLSLGIDVTIPRRVLIVSVATMKEYANTMEGQERLQDVENIVSREVKRYANSIILRNTGRQIILLPTSMVESVREFAKHLSKVVMEQYKIHLLIGIDGQSVDIHTSYLEANRAWHGAVHKLDGILCYRDMKTELFLDDIPRRQKTEYLARLFPNCNASKMKEYIGLLEAYFAAEGSLSEAAEILYIHKNTLQYRIKRLKEITGLDLRLPSQTSGLYLAMLFYHDLKNDISFFEK